MINTNQILMLNKQGHGPTSHRLRPVKPWSTGVKPTAIDPQLVTGEASDARDVRVCISNDQKGGRGHLRGAGTRPHPSVQTAGAEVARAHRNGARGGDRSSGERGFGVLVHGRSSWWSGSSPGSKPSTMTRPGTSYGVCSHDGDMAGGGELSGSATYATIERYRVR